MDDADLFNARHEFEEDEENSNDDGKRVAYDFEYDDYLYHLQKENEVENYLWSR